MMAFLPPASIAAMQLLTHMSNLFPYYYYYYYNYYSYYYYYYCRSGMDRFMGWPRDDCVRS